MPYTHNSEKLYTEQEVDDCIMEAKIELAFVLVSALNKNTQIDVLQQLKRSKYSGGAVDDFMSDFLGDYDTLDEYIEDVLRNVISVL